jgi:Cytochrome c
MRVVHGFFGLAALAAGLILGGGAFAASVEKGKAAYIQHGCWQCHGTQAQGGVTGPKLAPDPMPIETFPRHAALLGGDLIERGSRGYSRLFAGDPEAGRL